MLPDCRFPVSAETTRKWLKGIVFPDLENLVLLCNWLDLDLSSVFKTNHAAVVSAESNAIKFGRRASDKNYLEAVDLLGGLPDSCAELLIKLIKQLAEV